MAGDAVESGLPRHLAKANLHVAVTSRLPACRIHRHEAMDLQAVAGGALDVAQRARIGLEVDAVARGGRDPLPFLFLPIALHVTLRAHSRRDLCVHLYTLRAIGHPEIQLPHARED